MAEQDNSKIAARWREEKESAWLYQVVAEAEPNPARGRLFVKLAASAEEQAAILAGDLGEVPPRFRPSIRARLVAGITRILKPARSRALLAAMKVRGLSIYSVPASKLGHPMPTSVAEVGQRHGSSGASGALRAAVFGANDGLVSNTCLILGVAGASSDARMILLSGVAGLLAGAFSMAAGEYVSMRSQRDLLEYQIGQEREELERYPLQEAEELALIYNARGVPMDQARSMGRRILENPEQALNTLAREELGLNPEELGSPWGAAMYSFMAFSLGASVPLLPFLYGAGDHGVTAAAGLAGSALFAVGAALSLFSGRKALAGGLRMLLIGGAAGIATYAVGHVLGVRLS